MDFSQIINEHLEKYVSEKLPESVEKHLEKLIDSILGDIFSSYGDKQKQIKAAISEKIQINLEKLELIDYNGMIATAIQERFNILAQERSVEPIMKLIEDAVGTPYKKKKITLDELFDEVKEIVIDGAEYGDEGKVSFYAEYSQKHERYEVFADSEDDVSKKDCSVRFCFSNRWGKGTIYGLGFNHYFTDSRSPLDIASLGKVEKFIHLLWCSGVEISCDNTDDGDLDFDREWEYLPDFRTNIFIK